MMMISKMKTVPNPIVRDIKRRIKEREENCLILFVGKVRGGKSLCAWDLCQQVDPSFSNDRVVFNMKNFYQLIKDDSTNHRAILIDEMGVKADKREFMKYANKAIRWTFQTFAHKCNLVVMTVPSRGYIDEGIIKECSYLFVVDRTIKNEGKLVKSRFDVFIVQHNSRTNETYEKHPVFIIGGRRVVVKEMWLKPPCEEVIAEYKKYSIPYKNSINQEIEDNLDEIDAKNKEKKKNFNVDEMAANALNVYNDLKMQTKDSLDISKVSAYFDVGTRIARRIKAKVDLIKNGEGHTHTAISV